MERSPEIKGRMIGLGFRISCQKLTWKKFQTTITIDKEIEWRRVKDHMCIGIEISTNFILKVFVFLITLIPIV